MQPDQGETLEQGPEPGLTRQRPALLLGLPALQAGLNQSLDVGHAEDTRRQLLLLGLRLVLRDLELDDVTELLGQGELGDGQLRGSGE